MFVCKINSIETLMARERDSISLTSSIKVGKRIELIKRKWKPTLRFSEGKSPAISGETAKHRMRGEDERNKELFT